MNIYIPVEVKTRELESKVLLALEAASRGHEVLLGPLAVVFTWGPIGLLKPGVFHEKSLHPDEYKIKCFRDIVALGGVVTSIDEESGLLDASYDAFAEQRYSTETLDLCKGVFCWGDFDRKSLEKIYPKYKGLFLASGSPRVDLWHKEFDSLYLKDNREKVILIASNFGLTLNQNRFWLLQAHLRQEGYFKRGIDEFSSFDRYSYEIKLLKEFVQVIRKLSNLFPDEKIIVRPHPVEDTNGWNDLLGPLPNVEVNREDSINHWIRRSKAVIHNGCTSALEANVSNVPVIAYRPLKSEYERSFPNDISHQVFDEEELIGAVRDLLDGNPIESNSGLLKARLANLDQANAHKKMVDHWDQINAENPNLNERNNWSYLKARLRFSFLKKLLINRTFEDIARKNAKQPILQLEHAFPSLTQGELQSLVDSFAENNTNYSGMKIRKIFTKTFLIKKS